MNQDIINAVVGAVTNWDLIAQGVIIKRSKDCPLCKMFSTKEDEVHDTVCHRCPIFERTAYTGCIGTPWEGVNIVYPSFVNKYQCKGVEEEIEFLISLLPEDSKEAKAYEQSIKEG